MLDIAGGVFLGSSATLPRIAFLFPGQGAGRRGDGGALRRRFESVDELYRNAGLPTDGDLVATEAAQPRIVTGSVAGLRVLADLGIEAAGAAGHSLGELTALHWAGAMDEATLLQTAAARGRIMASASAGDGAMASVAAPADVVRQLLGDQPVVIAGYNSPHQTVISGPALAVDRVSTQATAKGLDVARVNVSHAFHSEAVAPAAEEFGTWLAGREFSPLSNRLVSTVTGRDVEDDVDVPALLARQIREPVRFSEAVAALAADADLIVEVGPGRILRGLASDIAPSVPAVSLETDSPSLAGLLRTVAAAYVLGAPVEHAALFADRFTRPLPLDKEFKFFASPCEAAPEDDFASLAAAAASVAGDKPGLELRLTVPEASAGAGADPLQVLLRLAAERAELPLEAVNPDSNPLDELHLSSITVGQIVNQACRELGFPPPLTTSAFATSSLAELAQMLTELGGAQAETDKPRGAAGVAPWVRAFAVDLVPARAQTPGAGGDPGDVSSWQLFTTPRHPLATALRGALENAGLGDGVLLCLPREVGADDTQLMLKAARAAIATPGQARFVVVGDRRGAQGLAKTLHLESPSVPTTVVTLPLPADMTEADAGAAVPRIVADVAGTSGFSEVVYDAAGERRVPVLRALPVEPATRVATLGASDVLLVTGGGKGITAECALSLAVQTGAKVGLLGRSVPEEDRELAANLDRMAAAGVAYHYARADVTSAEEVKAAVLEVQRELGPVTSVLHGAGRNHPIALANLDEAAFRRTLAPKIDGLENVLSAVDQGRLRLLVTFGSIIGRAGLRGQADYAVANDWMTDLTYRVREQSPDCKCLALEWSVWSGAGMGERLGVLESLMRDGIEPIPAEDGVQILARMIADPDAPVAAVVMGRAEGLPTITVPSAEVPLLRFLDRVQVHYPGVELVADCDLTGDGDLYLPDHFLDGDLLFPAVFGMEAMTQAASALTGRTGAPTLSDVEFLRPIVVPVEGSTTLRVAVLATGPDTVRAVIRSGETGFQADHFRATLTYGTPLPDLGTVPLEGAVLPLDPVRDLYGPVLFQGYRFQRLVGYRELAAKHTVAEIGNRAPAAWFAPFLSGELVLGDPGTRDAMMHSIQCCVPDATLLPAGIERLYLADPETVRSQGSVVLHGRERSRDGDTYVWDVDVRTVDGALVERWEGLTLRAVRKQDGSGPWTPTLLGPYLERRTDQVLPAELRVAVRPVAEGEAGDGAAALAARAQETLGWIRPADGVAAASPTGPGSRSPSPRRRQASPCPATSARPRSVRTRSGPRSSGTRA